MANGLSVTPDPEAFSPSACLNGLGKDLGTMTFPYNVKLCIRPDTDISALFERTRTYWENEGYELDEPEFLNGKRPANIEGSTPCVANSG